jgi:hypothetical protein
MLLETYIREVFWREVIRHPVPVLKLSIHHLLQHLDVALAE